jgi:hypothetical protein
MIQAPLQHLHATKGASHSRMHMLNPQMGEQRTVHGDEVTDGEQRKIQPPRLAGGRIDRTWPGGSLTSTEQVAAHHVPPVGVDGLARTDHGVPPAKWAVRGWPAGRVGVPGQCMADVYGIVTSTVELPIRLIGHIHLGELLTIGQRQRVASVEQPNHPGAGRQRWDRVCHVDTG